MTIVLPDRPVATVARRAAAIASTLSRGARQPDSASANYYPAERASQVKPEGSLPRSRRKPICDLFKLER